MSNKNPFNESLRLALELYARAGNEAQVYHMAQQAGVEVPENVLGILQEAKSRQEPEDV